MWLPCPVSAIPYVIHDGRAWATLDATEPQESGIACQDYWLALPEGWQVAPEPDAAVRANVIGAYGWGTDHLIVANGYTYWTANGTPKGQNPGEYYTNEWLFQNSNEYQARCYARILIYQARGMGARKKVECKGYSRVSTKSGHANHSNHVCPSLPFLTIGNHVIS